MGILINVNFRPAEPAIASTGPEEWVKADTMSVITRKDSRPDSYTTSISICIQLGPDQDDLENYCNATLRLNRGSKAVICGYPQEWAVWSEPVETHNQDSPTCEEMFDIDGLLLEDHGYTHMVSRVDEYNILVQLKQAIVKHFRKPEWKDHNPNINGKLAVIQLLDNAINDCRFNHIREVV